jgi:hypothetical protein
MWVGKVPQPMTIQSIAAEVGLEEDCDFYDIAELRARGAENLRSKIKHVGALDFDKARRLLATTQRTEHLWARGGEPYFLDEFLYDAQSGHKIVSTVYVECHSQYRTDGPDHLKPIGKVAFADEIAVESEKRTNGTRVCAGIVGYADLQAR